MSRTILNFTAICDKAGRPNNQDNFWICPDLSSYAATGTVTIGSSSTEVALTEKGALLVVADGMGGMSAGEVASQIVIDSVKRAFSDLKSISLSNSNAIKSFIKQAIIDADKEMKKHAESHPETGGMGSTIVLVWILDKTVYVGWCGDSRAYCYNAQNGLVRLTHDHSYVQELVDNDKLSEEDAFDHPDSNIITRSLGDSGEKANPDVKEYPLHTGDTFLLCSDGLCGLLRDSEIEEIMAQNSSIGNCLNALWKQGSAIGWTDNTTIELAKVLEGGIKPTAIPVGYEAYYKKKSNPISQTSTGIDKEIENNKSSIKRVGIVAAIAFVVGLIVGGFITKTFFPSYPADVEGEIKSLKFENDSLRMVI
jgi:serine/threonine protein phosphatase PrpC